MNAKVVLEWFGVFFAHDRIVSWETELNIHCTNLPGRGIKPNILMHYRTTGVHFTFSALP